MYDPTINDASMPTDINPFLPNVPKMSNGKANKEAPTGKDNKDEVIDIANAYIITVDFLSSFTLDNI